MTVYSCREENGSELSAMVGAIVSNTSVVARPSLALGWFKKAFERGKQDGYHPFIGEPAEDNVATADRSYDEAKVEKLITEGRTVYLLMETAEDSFSIVIEPCELVTEEKEK